MEQGCEGCAWHDEGAIVTQRKWQLSRIPFTLGMHRQYRSDGICAGKESKPESETGKRDDLAEVFLFLQ